VGTLQKRLAGDIHLHKIHHFGRRLKGLAGDLPRSKFRGKKSGFAYKKQKPYIPRTAKTLHKREKYVYFKFGGRFVSVAGDS
jgi:hypothetical protein